MRVVDQCFGAALVLGADGPPFSGSALRMTQSLFDVASSTLHVFRELTAARTVASQLQTALSTRVVTEQAKGMLAVQAGVSPDVAFEALRKYSRNGNLNLRELARELVACGGETDALRRCFPAAVSA